MADLSYTCIVKSVLTSLLTHIAYGSHPPCPAGHGSTDTEFWTDAISVAHRATSSSELSHAPGKASACGGIFLSFSTLTLLCTQVESK